MEANIFFVYSIFFLLFSSMYRIIKLHGNVDKMEFLVDWIYSIVEALLLRYIVCAKEMDSDSRADFLKSRINSLGLEELVEHNISFLQIDSNYKTPLKDKDNINANLKDGCSKCPTYALPFLQTEECEGIFLALELMQHCTCSLNCLIVRCSKTLCKWSCKNIVIYWKWQTNQPTKGLRYIYTVILSACAVPFSLETALFFKKVLSHVNNTK